MESGVFLLHSDNSLIRMNPQAYDVELLLQQLLSDHPQLLAGDQIDPESPRRFLLIQPEIGVPGGENEGDRWFLDHLFIDQDAIPTFVEVKRASDTRIRREVVAQMLDYAANATEYWPIDSIRARFGAHCERRGLDAGETLSSFLNVDEDVETFWSIVKANLSEGRVRLVFVADEIPLSLRRIVEFLNRQMSPAEVLAIEIRQYAPANDSPMRTLVPRVIGQTEHARQRKEQMSPAKKREPQRSSSRTDFIAACEESARPIIESILDAATRNGYRPDYLAQGANTWVKLGLAGVSDVPVYLDRQYLWVSLGRHSPVLRDPDINQQLRQAVLRLVPTNKPVLDPGKSEVGLRYDLIGRENLSEFDSILSISKAALSKSS